MSKLMDIHRISVDSYFQERVRAAVASLGINDHPYTWTDRNIMWVAADETIQSAYQYAIASGRYIAHMATICADSAIITDEHILNAVREVQKKYESPITPDSGNPEV